jgi:hypothetical protein
MISTLPIDCTNGCGLSTTRGALKDHLKICKLTE